MSNGHMSDLRTLAPGLADPAHDAQQLFRAILDATSHPGRIVSLPAAPSRPGRAERRRDGLSPHPGRPRHAGLAGRASSTGPRSATSCASMPARRSWRSVPTRSSPSWPSATPQPFEGFSLGTDAYPDRSATLIVEVADLSGRADAAVAWPGHRRPHRPSPLRACPTMFWQDWAANHGLFPCGVDIVFTAGTELCALPRSIAVES